MNDTNLWGLNPNHVNAVAQVGILLLTVILAAVAVFQQTIRGWFYRPRLELAVTGAPPDCVAVPIVNRITGESASSVFLRVRVENVGNATALNTEVHAARLLRRRADMAWEQVQAFPPMNLRWANVGGAIYFPRIAPGMGKPCDVAHITNPGERHKIGETLPAAFDAQRTALVFELQVAPNHLGHVTGPGVYRLDVIVAAENARPRPYTIEITLPGQWLDGQEPMLRDGIGIVRL